MGDHLAISFLWQGLIERCVSNAAREGPSSASTSARAGLVTFTARDLVEYLVGASGRSPSRAAAILLVESLRARDVIRARDGGEHRFEGNGVRWVCRNDEVLSSTTSFSVAALMNRPFYVLAAPMLKQGTLFLNSRFFVLDRAEARLYVFSSDVSSQPRYFIDFRRASAVVTLLRPSIGTGQKGAGEFESGWETDDSDTDVDDAGESSAGAYNSATPWLPRGTGLSALPPGGKGALWGFSIVCSGSGPSITAYAAHERRARVWVRSLTAAAACKPAREVLSHSQQRLRRATDIRPPRAALEVDALDGKVLRAAAIFEAEESAMRSASGKSLSSNVPAPEAGTLAIEPSRAAIPSSPRTPWLLSIFSPSSLLGTAASSSPRPVPENSPPLPSPAMTGPQGGTAPVAAPFFYPAAVRALLSVPQSFVRASGVSETWARTYAEALADLDNSGRARDSPLPSWALIDEDTPSSLLCDLYADPLELYVSCVGATLGTSPFALPESVLARTGGAMDLRPLRLLMLEPARAARDVGIVNPAHVRALLERIAAFVRPLDIEGDAEAARRMSIAPRPDEGAHQRPSAMPPTPTRASSDRPPRPTPPPGRPSLGRQLSFVGDDTAVPSQVRRESSASVFSASFGDTLESVLSVRPTLARGTSFSRTPLSRGSSSRALSFISSPVRERSFPRTRSLDVRQLDEALSNTAQTPATLAAVSGIVRDRSVFVVARNNVDMQIKSAFSGFYSKSLKVGDLDSPGASDTSPTMRRLINESSSAMDDERLAAALLPRFPSTIGDGSSVSNVTGRESPPPPVDPSPPPPRAASTPADVYRTLLSSAPRPWEAPGASAYEVWAHEGATAAATAQLLYFSFAPCAPGANDAAVEWDALDAAFTAWTNSVLYPSAGATRRRASSADQYVYGAGSPNSSRRMSPEVEQLSSSPSSLPPAPLPKPAVAAAHGTAGMSVVDPALVGKAISTGVARLKGMFSQQVVSMLCSSAHPVGALAQRVAASLGTLYGPETLPWLGLDADEAAESLRADIKAVLSRTAVIVREWVAAWVAGINDWGSTGAAMKPSGGFLRAHAWGNESGVGATDALLETLDVFARVIPVDERAALSADSTSAPLPPKASGAWRYLCRFARAIAFSDRDVSETAHEAVATFFFERASLGLSAASIYRTVFSADDATLRSAQAELSGLTTTQLELAADLRVDVTAPAITFFGGGSSIFSKVTTTALDMCAAVALRAPLPRWTLAANAGGAPTAPSTGAWPVYAAGTHASPASLAALKPAIDIFATMTKVVAPHQKLRLLCATVDALCRCISAFRGAVAGLNAAPVEPAHINADDLLGLLCVVSLNCGVPSLCSELAALGDFATEDDLIERPGFLLTSLQAALLYATSDDILDRRACGHCERSGAIPCVVCSPCGRLLCAECDDYIHAQGLGAEAHQRSRLALGGVTEESPARHGAHALSQISGGTRSRKGSNAPLPAALVRDATGIDVMSAEGGGSGEGEGSARSRRASNAGSERRRAGSAGHLGVLSSTSAWLLRQPVDDSGAVDVSGFSAVATAAEELLTSNLSRYSVGAPDVSDDDQEGVDGVAQEEEVV